MNKAFESIESAVDSLGLKFPFFVRFGEQYSCVLSESNIARVELWGHSIGIEIVSLSVINPFGNKGWEFITQQEFDEAFEKALAHVSKFSKVVA